MNGFFLDFLQSSKIFLSAYLLKLFKMEKFYKVARKIVNLKIFNFYKSDQNENIKFSQFKIKILSSSVRI